MANFPCSWPTMTSTLVVEVAFLRSESPAPNAGANVSGAMDALSAPTVDAGSMHLEALFGSEEDDDDEDDDDETGDGPVVVDTGDGASS